MNEEDLKMYRHSMSHVLAKAITRLYKNVKLAIGPSIDDGFYYDFDLETTLTPDDAEKIEAEMKKIIDENQDFTRKEISKAEALKLFADQPYKIELINELPENETISMYYLGDDFFDLCRGPHVENTKFLRSFAYKLNRVSGAYWKGSEKNKMLQRVYMYGYANKEDLKAKIKQVEEAKARDHNKIGRELDYFTTVDYIGQGLPIIMPKGAKVIQILQRFVEDEENKLGYLLTKTPYMSKNDLFKISGHWDHYKESMFILGEEGKDKEVYCLRPMTCPFQYQVYLNRPRSYKDLPMKLGETSTLFRNEASGECHGLIRVRQFTISEGHLMVLPEQLEDIFKECLDLAQYVLKCIGLDEDVTYRFSKWDKNNKEKYIGSEEKWERVQGEMRRILTDLKIPFYEADGEAAFYGPKLDIQIKNVFGKEDTIVTIQIDFQIAERFNMVYTDADGVKKNPYIIHRTSLGCYERTLAYLLEKFAGALPFWMAPEQVRVLTISDEFNDYAKEILSKLQAVGLRASFDSRSESISKKIKIGTQEKVPYLLIVGAKEKEEGTVAVRKFGKGDLGARKIDEVIKEFIDLVANKTIEK